MSSIHRYRKKIYVVLFAAILAIAVFLRIHEVQERSLWFDEAVSILIGGTDVAGAIRAADAEGLPPLYNLVLCAFLSWFKGEAAARLLSALFGVITVYLVYLTGRELSDERTGLVAAALLSTSGFHLWYSQEIRVYTLQALLVTGSCLFMLRLLKSGSKRDVAGYSILSGLAVYAQYSTLFVLLFQNLFFLLAWKETRERLARWIAAQVLTAIFFLPWLPAFVRHFFARSNEFWLPDMTPVYLFSHFYNFTGGLQSRTSLNVFFAWLSLAVLVLVGLLVLLRQETKKSGLFLSLWFWVPTLALVLVSLRQNIFLSRALLYTLPAFCLLVGLVVGPWLIRSWRSIPAAVSLAGLLLVNVYAISHYYGDDNWWIKPPHRTNARRVASLFEEGDILVHTSRFTYRPYQYYMNGQYPMCLLKETEDLPGLFEVIGRSDPPEDTSGFDRIWLVAYADFQQPGLHGRVVEWMRSNHEMLDVVYRDRLNFVVLFHRNADRLLPSLY